MKRKITVKASGMATSDKAKLGKIIQRMKDLLDAMEDTPSGFIDAHDLGDLYERLIEDIPAASFEYKNM